MLKPGDVIDERYEIIGTLGTGSFAVVFKARDRQLDRITALKVLHAEKVDDIDAARFTREAKLIAELRHKNIVSCYKLSFADGAVYCAMEFVEGSTLGQLVGNVAWPRLLSLAIQICDGMQHAHANGVIHRDLTPNNVIVTTDGAGQEVARIVDFGLARIVDADKSGQKLTKTGHCVGTVLYMSPEVCSGRPADARSDIYSLGCIIYECLTGKFPFDADNPFEFMRQHVAAPVPSCSQNCQQEGLPSSLDLVLKKAMSKSADDRYQSMDQFAEDLRSVLDGSKPRATNRSTRVFRRPKSLVLQVVAVVFVLLIAMVLLFPVPVVTETLRLTVPPEQRVWTVLDYERFLRTIGLKYPADSLLSYYAAEVQKNRLSSIESAAIMASVACATNDPDYSGNYSPANLSAHYFLDVVQNTAPENPRLRQVAPLVIRAVKAGKADIKLVVDCLDIAKHTVEFRRSFCEAALTQAERLYASGATGLVGVFNGVRDLTATPIMPELFDRASYRIADVILGFEYRSRVRSEMLRDAIAKLAANNRTSVGDKICKMILKARAGNAEALLDRSYAEFFLSYSSGWRGDKVATQTYLLQALKDGLDARKAGASPDGIGQHLADMFVASRTLSGDPTQLKRAYEFGMEHPEYELAYNGVMMIKAQELINEGRYQRADSILENASSRLPVTAQYALAGLLSVTRQHLGPLSEAIKFKKMQLQIATEQASYQLPAVEKELQALLELRKMHPELDVRQPRESKSVYADEFEAIRRMLFSGSVEESLRRLDKLQKRESLMESSDRTRLYSLKVRALAWKGDRRAAWDLLKNSLVKADFDSANAMELVDQCFGLAPGPSEALKLACPAVVKMEQYWNPSLNSSVVYVRICQSFSQQKDFHKAQKWIRRGLARHVNNRFRLREYAELSRVLTECGELEKARQVLAQAEVDPIMWILPDELKLEYRVAAAQASVAGDMEQLRFQLAKAQALFPLVDQLANPGNAIHYGHFRAQYYWRRGSALHEISELSNQVLHDDPGWKLVSDYECLSTLYQMRGSFEAAYDKLLDGVKRYPRQTALYMMLADVCVLRHRNDEAVRYYKEALHLDFATATFLSPYFPRVGAVVAGPGLKS